MKEELNATTYNEPLTQHIIQHLWKYPSGLTEEEEAVIKLLLPFQEPLLYGTFLGEWINLTGSTQLKEVTRILDELSGRNGLVERQSKNAKEFITLTDLGRMYYIDDKDILRVDYPVYLLMDRTLLLDGEPIIQNIGLSPEFIGQPTEFPSVITNEINIHEREDVEHLLLEKGSCQYTYLHYHQYIASLEKLIVHGSPRFAQATDTTTVFYDVPFENIHQVLHSNGFVRTVNSHYAFKDHEGNLHHYALDNLIHTYPTHTLPASVEEITSLPPYPKDYDFNPKYLHFNFTDQTYVVNEEATAQSLSETVSVLDNAFNWIVVTDQQHIKVRLNQLEKMLETCKQSQMPIKAIFPLRKPEIDNTSTLEPERIYYFLNNRGGVKLCRENELTTRNSQVHATVMKDDEHIVQVAASDEGEGKGKLLFVSKEGYVKLVNTWEFKPKHKASLYVIGMYLGEDDELVYANIYPEETQEFEIYLNGTPHVFTAKELVATKMTKGTRCRFKGSQVNEVSVSTTDCNVLL